MDKNDPVHDASHVYRVVNNACQILDHSPKADQEIVLIASLLHDIGRGKRENGKKAPHGKIGAQMAEVFLKEQEYPPEKIRHIADCIISHSYPYKGKGLSPQTLEAQIVYDADKLDLTGPIGVIRAVGYGSQIGEPYYLFDKQGNPLLTQQEAKGRDGHTLIKEYWTKLQHMSSGFYTDWGKQLAKVQQKMMDTFFLSFVTQLKENSEKGSVALEKIIKP
ncbi:MAG: HD domain-containing protein [Clostridiales bacterium]|nr:HD domain-containing protein [Clostridiales bacterium]